MSLSPEQMMLVQANRQAALARKAAKSPSPSTSVGIDSAVNPQAQDSSSVAVLKPVGQRLSSKTEHSPRL